MRSLQKKILSSVIKILLFFIVFFLLLAIRAYWDSYRFYKNGLAKENENLLESIRYYGSSIKSFPLNSKYKELSEKRLKLILQKTKDERVKMMIEDELSN